MKKKIIYTIFALLVISIPCKAQKSTEIILNNAWATWKNEPTALNISMSITINNPSFSGNNFNLRLNRHITEYVNNKIINDQSSIFANADWGGTKNMLHWVSVPSNELKPGTTGRIIISVDNYEYYKNGNKSAPQKISLEISYKLSILNDILIVENMKNHFPDGTKSGSDYKPLTVENNSSTNSADAFQSINEQRDKQTPLSPQSYITAEINSTTGHPWKYVVSDGKSYVEIDISLPGVNMINYSVINNSGSLSTSTGNAGNTSGILNLTSGSGKLYYFPPQEIPEATGYLTSNTQQKKPIRYFPAKINFTYTSDKGNNQSKTIEINYCRTPVILVHGFTGNKSTWELLDRMLIQKGYMTHRGDYYARNELSGSMDIAAQSYLLEKNIKEEMDIFRSNNIKCSSLDIICHSMGGLIARHYSTMHPSKGRQVRKIIMVGTPNHGIYDAMSLMAGEAAAYFSEAHKGMAVDVDATSRIMKNFNNGEAGGTHLNPSIQYGNIYVEGSDGVVEGRSARLNGVAEVLLTQMKHSPAIPNTMGYGTKSITTDFMVFGKILNWLQNPIPRASLNMNKWDNEYSLSIGKEYKLSEKGHVVKVLKGNLIINTELRKLNADASTTAQITYADGSVINIQPGTRLNYNEDLTEILLHKGKTIYNLKKQGQNKFVVITPSLQAGVRGTCFEVSVQDEGTSNVHLYEGELEIENLSGKRTIKTGQYTTGTNGNLIKQGNFNPEARFNSEWREMPGFTSLSNFIGKRGSLFSQVEIGGGSPVNKVATGGTNCLGSLKTQFLLRISGSPANQQQQAQMKVAADRNNRELKWFKDAETKFKQGVLPTELSGTYRPNPNGKAGTGKYYSETVVLFTPMKIISVSGEAEGFSITHGDSQKTTHFSEMEKSVGTILPCGSYKLIPDANENRATNWVTVKLEKAD